MNTSPITRRLLRTFDSATDVQRRNGIAWYGEAYNLATELAGEDFTREQAAGVIAVLSPNQSWKGNVSMARRVFDCFRAGVAVEDCNAGLGANVRKAYRVLQGDLTAIAGPKVTAFYRNILGDPNNVTVDIWATRAAVGRSIPGRDHDRIILAYQRAAARRGVSPRDFQAIVWVTVRDLQLQLF